MLVIIKLRLAIPEKILRREKKGKWPSAYASGALVQCRKVGAKNWGNSVKKGWRSFQKKTWFESRLSRKVKKTEMESKGLGFLSIM